MCARYYEAIILSVAAIVWTVECLLCLRGVGREVRSLNLKANAIVP